MLTQVEASALREKINEEAPYLDVQIRTEETPLINYYLVVSQKGKMCFVVRDETQWQERKHLVIF